MKALLIMAICAFLATPALAAFDGPGAQKAPIAAESGFKGPIAGATAETVDKALQLPDGAPVVLTGQVISRVAGTKDKFNFKDDTGNVVVDIDKKVFQGRTVTPDNKVRISGKVDKDFNKPVKIDAKVLEILQ